MAVSASSAIEQVREERRALVVSQITASGISDEAALEVAASLLPQLSNRGAGQLPALQTLLPLLQASPLLCSSFLNRLLPPLLTIASRPGAPSSLLSATFPCLELLVRHSSSQSESGRQVASAVPSLLTTLLLTVREGSTCRPTSLSLLISIMSRYPGSCGQAASKIENTLVSTLGHGIGLKLLGKAFSLLPQLGGGGKEGVEHSNAHMRLVLSMIATLHIGLDTLLEHKVKEFPCARPTSTTPLTLPPCNGSALERATLLSKQLQELTSILGSLLTRGFPTSRSVPVDLVLSLSSRLLSLSASLEDDLTLILPRLTASFIDLLVDLVDSCGDLLLPEAASINSLIVSGLTRKEKLSLTIRRALHDLVAAWCHSVGPACGLDLCSAQILPPLLKEVLPRKPEVLLDQSVRRKGKKNKVVSIQASSQQPSISNVTTEQPSSAFVALEAILTAVGPWLDAETHQMVSSTLLSLSLSPSSSSNLSSKLLASLCSSPHQCTVPLVLPALHQGSLVIGKSKVDAIAEVKSLLPIIHPKCASLDLKATPMICTSLLAHAVGSLEDEGEENVEETESELSAQLREAREKISALEDKLKAQEKLLREEQQKRVEGSESADAEHVRSLGEVNDKSMSQNIGLKRPATAAAEEGTTSQFVKKVRGTDDNFGQEEVDTSLKTKHPDAITAQPFELRASTSEPTTSVPSNITTSTSKGFLNNTAPSKSTATALPSVSASGEGVAAAQQLTVEEMLADFKDKLSDNLLRMGNPSYVNASLQDSDSD